MNINRLVSVRLTARGREVLEDFYEKERAELPLRLHYLFQAKPEADGSFRFQFYELMAIFGPSMPTGATSDARYLIFEDNQINTVSTGDDTWAAQHYGLTGVRTRDGDVFYGESLDVAVDR